MTSKTADTSKAGKSTSNIILLLAERDLQMLRPHFKNASAQPWFRLDDVCPDDCAIGRRRETRGFLITARRLRVGRACGTIAGRSRSLVGRKASFPRRRRSTMLEAQHSLNRQKMFLGDASRAVLVEIAVDFHPELSRVGA